MATPTLHFGPYRVDLTHEQVWHGAAELHLRPQSFAVLRQLLTHAGQLLTKEALWHAVWPEVMVGDKALAAGIGELRKALGDDPQAPRFIATVHRRGYRFIAPVTAVDAAETTPATSAPHPPRPPLPVGREAEMRQLHGWFA
jgi:DNA-binding winged helix-turn-helix (wHTH) protein